MRRTSVNTHQIFDLFELHKKQLTDKEVSNSLVDNDNVELTLDGWKDLPAWD